MTAATRPRLGALDLLRGLTVAAMILVNNPGNWNRVYPPLSHAAWHGATAADFIFPAFIVIMGVAMSFVLRPPASEEGRRHIDAAIVRRAAVLIALGLVLNVAAAWPHPLSARIPGVLQRLGVTYLVAALIVVRTTPRQQGLLAAALLAAHWGLLLVGGSLAPATNLGARLDQLLFGAHLLNPGNDPEGALGTLSCVATALLGVGMGRLLSGAVFAEIVFNRPGVGRLVFESVNSRNYPIVMGAVMVTTVLFALSTLLSDLAAAALDPRTRDKL